jgi:hypothetical protein
MKAGCGKQQPTSGKATVSDKEYIFESNISAINKT